MQSNPWTLEYRGLILRKQFRVFNRTVMVYLQPGLDLVERRQVVKTRYADQHSSGCNYLALLAGDT